MNANRHLFKINEYFSICVGPASSDEFKGDLYKVVNNHTDVAEVEASVLAQALVAANEMEEDLRKAALDSNLDLDKLTETSFVTVN